MNTIDTSLIVDPNVQQPFTGPSLAFLQNATLEAISNVVKGLAYPSYSSSQVYVLYGCERTGAADGAASGAAAVAAGAVFYNGEVFTVPAFSTTNINSQTLYSALVSTSVSPDPVLFSDNSSKNVHFQRQWVVSQSGSGSNAQSSWVYLSKPTWNYIGDSGKPTFKTNWGNYNLLGYGDPVGYSIDKDGFLCLRGIATNTGNVSPTLFTLPVGFRPTSKVVLGLTTDSVSAPLSLSDNSTMTQMTITIASTGDVSIGSTTAGHTYLVYLNNLRLPLTW